ncbi:hypothetical protein LRS10_00910 [Phenylobacterium sp. J426]|uniref:hypothetical protein n=1 Tax=Phenylobacterium sp. J426 TaxID=2898439 RepID=UPI00215131B3|nr:hypothetical protein [Phenylobacterium sp. J426]MCR5872879.1 hypothetical protein [Phenylobacterium sp. J426]
MSAPDPLQTFVWQVIVRAMITSENLSYVPKQRLLKLMRDWGEGKITTEEMSYWCCNNYLPGAQTDDPLLPDHQQRAVHEVLQAFEWQAHDDQLVARREGWRQAIEFLNCTAENFDATKLAFERECAGTAVP